MPTSTFRPVAGATAPADGHVRRDGVNESFSSIRSGAGSYNTETELSALAGLFASGTTDQYSDLNRAIFVFDTSSIPDTDTIDSATLYFTPREKNDGLGGSHSICIVKPSPASPSDFANSDYNIANWDMTKQTTADMTIGSMSVDTEFSLTLNATGLSNISKTGYTYLGMVLDNDQANSAPTWVSGQNAYVGMYSADETGTTKDPRLEVTHSAASTTVSPLLLSDL